MSKVERHMKVSPNLDNLEVLRGKLSEELTSLEHSLNRLRGGYTQNDLSLCQTYKEMIHGRRELLNRISVN
jgi:hypothetical protein